MIAIYVRCENGRCILYYVLGICLFYEEKKMCSKYVVLVQ